MKLTDMPNSDTRHRYWKCSNPEDHIFTVVLFMGAGEQVFLKTLFSRVELAEHMLPAWRLYQVVED